MKCPNCKSENPYWLDVYECTFSNEWDQDGLQEYFDPFCDYYLDIRRKQDWEYLSQFFVCMECGETIS